MANGKETGCFENKVLCVVLREDSLGCEMNSETWLYKEILGNFRPRGFGANRQHPL